MYRSSTGWQQIDIQLQKLCTSYSWWNLLFLLFFLQCFDFVGLTWGADTMSVKQKTVQPLGFPVVLWHCRLNGRKDTRLIKIQWLFQYVSLCGSTGLSWIIGCKRLFFSSFLSFAAISYPIWGEHGGMVLKKMYGVKGTCCALNNFSALTMLAGCQEGSKAC